MAGDKNSTEKLDRTLVRIVQLLQQHQLTNWCIGYGTLLGIVRSEHCIENDDDVDILIDGSYFHKLHKILSDSGFKTTTSYGIGNSTSIVKIESSSEYSSVDFYCCKYNDATKDFHDTWEKVVWSKCKDEDDKFISKEWNGVILQLPQQYIEKLVGRYGQDWRTPKQSKGVMPRKTVL